MMQSWDQVEAALDRAAADERAAALEFRAIPGLGSGPLGLTPDNVKATPAYRQARAAYDKTNARLRSLNAFAVRHFKAQMAARARAKREARA